MQTTFDKSLAASLIRVGIPVDGFFKAYPASSIRGENYLTASAAWFTPLRINFDWSLGANFEPMSVAVSTV